MEIKIDEALKNKIETLQYEVESRKDLISYMIANDVNTSSEQFKKYEREYHDFFVQYNKAKDEMVKKYLQDINYNSWNLNFSNSILNVVLK